MSLSNKLKILKNSLEEGADSAVKKSQTFIEYSDLSLTASSIKKKIEDIYTKIGEKIYKDLKDGNPDLLNLKDIFEYCDEIKELEKELSKVKKKMLKLKSKKECKKCGSLIDKKAHFCDKCGVEQ
jgi:hypothetical protein